MFKFLCPTCSHVPVGGDTIVHWSPKTDEYLNLEFGNPLFWLCLFRFRPSVLLFIRHWEGFHCRMHFCIPLRANAVYSCLNSRITCLRVRTLMSPPLCNYDAVERSSRKTVDSFEITLHISHLSKIVNHQNMFGCNVTVCTVYKLNVSVNFNVF